MDLVSTDRVLRLNPVFGAMGLEAVRKIWAPSKLSAREKAVLLVAGDVAVRELGLPFELHTAMAMRKAGMSVEDLRELLRHVAPAAGLNPTSRAFERLVTVAKGLGAREESRAERVPAPHPAPPYPENAMNRLRSADPRLAASIEAQSAELWARPGLSHRERLFASLAIDVAGGAFGPAFAAHVRMTLSAGVTMAEIQEALRILAEYSTVKAWEAAIQIQDLASPAGASGKDRQPSTVESTVEVARFDRSILNEADASGVAIVETRLVERFTGGVTGEGQAVHLRLERADGTGALICYERITGSVGGRQGSFLLEATGVMAPGAVVHGRWRVVGGSGAGELKGLAARPSPPCATREPRRAGAPARH